MQSISQEVMENLKNLTTDSHNKNYSSTLFVKEQFLLCFFGSQLAHVLICILFVEHKLRYHDGIQNERYCITSKHGYIKANKVNGGNHTDCRPRKIHENSNNRLSASMLLFVIAIDLRPS